MKTASGFRATLLLLPLLIPATTVSAAPSSTRHIPLLGDNLAPEGIAYREKTRTFYVGSMGNGSVQTVRQGEKARIIQPAGTDGHTQLLGLKVDEARGHLWMVDGKAAYIYDLKSGKLLKKDALADVVKDVKDSALNDLAIDAEGSAYITDSFNPIILKVDGKTLEMKVFRDVSKIPFGKQNDFPYNLNGIVQTPDGKSLIAVKTNDGGLWRIGVDSEEVSEVKVSEPLTKGDGLVWGKGERLYIVRNFENKISYIDWADKMIVKQVKSFLPEGVTVPTTAVFLDRGKHGQLAVVNSQFGVKTPQLPYVITLIPINE